jgi:hypothetical protein
MSLLANVQLTASNRIIVRHANVAGKTTSISPGAGAVIIFECDGYDGFYLLGRLTAEAWEGIAVEER